MIRDAINVRIFPRIRMLTDLGSPCSFGIQMRHGSPVPLDRVARFSPSVQRIITVEAARYCKDVFGIMPNLLIETACPNSESPLFIGFPLVAGENKNRNILIGISGCPTWMP